MSARTCDKAGAVAVAVTALFLSSAAAAEGVSLRSFAAQQVRLAAIADRIGEAGVNSCEKPRMVTGMILHDLSGYDPGVRKAVASAFSLGAGVGVIQIVPGSPADRAGLRIDDEILAIGNQGIVDPSAAYARKKTYARTERVTAILDAALSEGRTDLVVNRSGKLIRVSLAAERGCGGQLALTNSNEMNAWSDGNRVMMTTAMMKLAQSDDELAFVIAHEMAHNILGHSRSRSSGIFGFAFGIGKARQDELAADRMAVQLMSGAGYQASGGLTFLEKVRRRFWWNVSLDHPGFGRRIHEVNSEIMATAALQSSAKVSDERLRVAATRGSFKTGRADAAAAANDPIEFADGSVAPVWPTPRIVRTNCAP